MVLQAVRPQLAPCLEDKSSSHECTFWCSPDSQLYPQRYNLCCSGPYSQGTAPTCGLGLIPYTTALLALGAVILLFPWATVVRINAGLLFSSGLI